MRCALNSVLIASALFAGTAIAQETYPFPGHVLEKKRLDSERSAVLVDTEKPGPGRWGLYIVSNQDNRQLLALDTDSDGALAASPVLETFNANSVYLHYYGDYGFYRGSIKYLVDRSPGTPAVKIPYDILGLSSLTRAGDKLSYFALSGDLGPFGPKHRATIIVTPQDSRLPSAQIMDAAGAAEQAAVEPGASTGPGGEAVLVANVTPPGQSHRPSIIFVDNKAFPAPIPTLHFYQQTFPEKQPPAEMQSDIGPFVQKGQTIWFATEFYDGEGVSGIGAIGSFDIPTRQYQMRYLPEIAPWSGSAIMLDGDDLWIGLKRQPEGVQIGGGLLRYSISSGKVQMFAIPDVIFTIDRVGDALYCGSSHGLYMLRGDHITQLRFEPDQSGQLVMIPRDVAPAERVRPNAR